MWLGRGCGKTHFIRLLWNLFVSQHDGVLRSGVSPDGIRFEQRGIRIIHLMPTFKQAKDVYAKLVEAELTGAGPWSFLGAKINKSTWSITFPGGSWIQWFGAREANSARGMRADIVTIDEADDIEPADHDAVVIPWTSEPWSLNIRVLAGTPRRGRQGLLYREGMRGQRRENGYHCVHATYKDSPGVVSTAQVEEARRNTTPAVFSREWECNFDSAEGLVYSMFDESFHVRKAPAGPWDEILVGVDHGWEDPGVFLVIGVRGNGRDSECHILEEVYEQYKEESWWIAQAKRLREKYQRFPMRWYGDPSRPDRCRAIGNGAGVRFFETNNAIQDGISAVTDRLIVRVAPPTSLQFSDAPSVKRTRLFVDPSCKFTIWELNNYRRRRDPSDENRFLEQIVDKNNHAMDALRYAVFSRFGKPAATRIDSGGGWS